MHRPEALVGGPASGPGGPGSCEPKALGTAALARPTSACVSSPQKSLAEAFGADQYADARKEVLTNMFSRPMQVSGPGVPAPRRLAPQPARALFLPWRPVARGPVEPGGGCRPGCAQVRAARRLGGSWPACRAGLERVLRRLCCPALPEKEAGRVKEVEGGRRPPCVCVEGSHSEEQPCSGERPGRLWAASERVLGQRPRA